MGKVEVDKVAINLRILKQCRFYQMFDPNSPKFLNRNVYQVLCIVVTVFALCVLLLGHVGMFTNKDETLSDIDLLLLMYMDICSYLSVIKTSVFLYNANTVWDLFDVARLDFLTNKECRKNINLLYDCRDWIKKVSNCFFFVTLVVSSQWILVPLVMNTYDGTDNGLNQNILNFRYPVSNHTYNRYFVIFYVSELIVGLLSTYGLITIDILIMSLCWVIIILYQILTKSFADVGYANKPQSEYYEDFKSILSDQIQLHLKLKLFYDIIRPIMSIYVGLSSCLIITITCAFITAICIVIIGNNERLGATTTYTQILNFPRGKKNVLFVCSSLGSYSTFEVLKLGSSVSFLYIEMFLFCYLLDHINTNRDSVNFGMYSSNWTMMDLKFKKVLLLAMRINDDNQIVLKAFPNKIINLQLFANVMKICYNITSVMLKTMKNKQK